MCTTNMPVRVLNQHISCPSRCGTVVKTLVSLFIHPSSSLAEEGWVSPTIESKKNKKFSIHRCAGFQKSPNINCVN